MTKNNGIPIEVNKKSFEMVQEIKNETPSYEEFMKTYESDNKVNYDDLTFSDISDKGKGYGPCKNSSCSCYCSSSTCNCKSAESAMFNKDYFKIGSNEVSGRAGTEKGYIKADGEASISLFRAKDPFSDTKIFSASVGGEVGPSPLGYGGKLRAGINAIDFKTDGFEGRVGLNVDTGLTNEEAKLLGFGVNFGKKKGISTPVGEIKTDNCVIQ